MLLCLQLDRKVFSEMQIPDREGINLYLLHSVNSNFCLSSCQNEAGSGQMGNGQMQIIWFRK